MLQSLVQPVARDVTAPGSMSQIQRAINLLRSKGADAHLWDFSTLTGLYQDSAGTTPVTAPDQPIGLVLDSMGVLGSELVTNGGFDTDTAWTKGTGVTIGSGALVFATSSIQSATQDISISSGKTYKITFTAVVSSGNMSMFLGGASVKANFITGSYSFYATAGSFNTAVSFDTLNACNATIDNISVREISGVHCSQATSVKKPTLRRGIVNRLTYSHDLSNAAWVKDANTTSVTGGEIVVNNTVHSQRQTFTVVAGNTYTLALEAKRGTMTDAKTSVYNLTGAANIVAPSSFYSEINSVDYSYVVRTFTAPVGCTTIYAYALRDSGVIGSTFVRSLGLFQGTLTASEILAYGGIPLTTSAPASSSQGHYWAEFDGVDDCMVAANMNLSGTDKITYLAGATKVGSTSWSTLLEHTGNSDLNAGAFSFLAPGGTSDSIYVSARGATGNATKSTTGYAPPASVVLSNRADLSAATSIGANNFRVNGVTVASAGGGAAPGGGNFANSSLFIGQRNAASFPFSGAVSSVSVISSLLTDAELLLIERLAANKAGISL